MVWCKPPAWARMMNQSVIYVGLDVHNETIAIAVAEDGKRAEVSRAWRDREHKGSGS